MSVIKLFAINPKDGTSTFDQVKFYEADDNAGTGAALVATEDIDTTTADIDFPGYTSYVHTTGDTAKYCNSKWYNSGSTLTSDYGDTWVLQGNDRIDTRFGQEMADTSNAVFSATEVDNFKDAALQEMYPELFANVIDASLTIVNSTTTQTYLYTVPAGIFAINEVGIGYPNHTAAQSRSFKIVKSTNYTIEGNTLKFDSISGFTNGYPIRLLASKKFQEIGELPKVYDYILILHMKMQAYLRLADDFPRFKKWSKLQEGTKVSFENLRVHAREFERKFKEAKAAARDTGGTVLSK